MKRRFFLMTSTILAATLLVAGCSQAAPTPAATKAPSEPTKTAAPTAAPKPTSAPEPTKAPAPAKAAEPTKSAATAAAPAKKIDFPIAGKAISIVVPFAPGGYTDLAARVLAPELEKELNAPVQVVNKAGAGSQVGLTEVVQSKPDGHTLLFVSFPTALATYLDPQRKAIYTRKDFLPVAQTLAPAVLVAVKADSPFKGLKDLVDTAKANPEKVTVAVGGLKSAVHLPALLIEKVAGVKLAAVTSGGGGENVTALLGGHVDAALVLGPEVQQHFDSGAVRVIAVLDDQEDKYFPGAKTAEAQGYKVYGRSHNVVLVPAGTPREIVDTLSGIIKKRLENDELRKKMDGMGMVPRYLNPDQLADLWIKLEDEVGPFIREP